MSRNDPAVVIFDLDGTITRYDTYVRFLVYSIYQQPLKTLRLPGLAIDVVRHKLGKQTNTWLKKRFLAAILAGQKRSEIDTRAKKYASYVAETGVHNDALACIKSHQDLGHELILLSASLDIYVEPLGELLGFKNIICTRTSWIEDVLCHELDGGNCYGDAKVDRLRQSLDRASDVNILVAYGDHEADFPLLKIAQRGVVVNPDEKLRVKAGDHQLEFVEWQ